MSNKNAILLILLYSHLRQSKGNDTNKDRKNSPGELHVFYFSGRSRAWKTERNPCIVGKYDSEKRFYNPWAEEDWRKLRHLWQGQACYSNIWKSRNIKSKRSGDPLLLNYRFLLYSRKYISEYCKVHVSVWLVKVLVKKLGYLKMELFQKPVFSWIYSLIHKINHKHNNNKFMEDLVIFSRKSKH